MAAQLIILFSLFAVCLSHVCLLHPLQRGSISGLNKAASPDCILLKSPCGGRPSKHSGAISMEAEKNITIIFQKNLNHFNQDKPGYFSISFGVDDIASTFKEVARIPDKNEPDLYLYTTEVTLPPLQGHPHQILQVAYVTNNPKAPPAFYQCSDIMLYK